MPTFRNVGARVGKLLAFALGGYVCLVVLSTVAMFGLVGLSRLLGRNPEIQDSPLPDIKHLRRVDEHLLAGAQPSRDDFRGLAEAGIKLVVDLRTGAADDPTRDDPAWLAELGMEYVSIPVRDGQAPPPEAIRTFLDVMDEEPGPVFMHCGGGVGRSTSLQAAYQAWRGENPPLLDYLAVGPPTIEQAWFIHKVSDGEPIESNNVMNTISRGLDAPRRFWSWFTHRD